MSRTFLRVFAAVVAGPLVIGLAASAQAQTIGLPQVLDRTVQPLRDTIHQPYWVSQSDCVGENDLIFNPVTFTNGTTATAVGQTLEVWAGQNSCTEYTARSGNAPTCWLVYSERVAANNETITIKARDIAGRHLPNETGLRGPGSGALTDCYAAGNAALNLGLYFMFVNGTNTIGTGATWSKTTLDIWGPSPPITVNGTPGETRIHLGWSTSGVSTDTKEWRFYCQPLTAVYDAGLTAAVASPTGTVRQLLEAGAGGTTSWFPDGAVATGGAGTGGATSTQADCAPGLAVSSGTLPDEKYRCGGAAGTYTDRGTAEGLTNGVDYAVSVAAVDEVGNVGLLSANVCATPVNVTDFFELYRMMGGKGGGGYCSIAPLGRSPLFPLAALAGAIGFVVVRRRRKR